MCMAGIFWPVNMLMVNVIAASGNAKAILRLEIIRTVILVPVYIYAFAVMADIIVFLWLLVGLRLVSLCLNASYVTKEIPVTMKEQFVIVFMYVLQGGIALLTSQFFFRYVPIEERWLRVLLYMGLFGAVYMLLQYLIKTSALKEMNNVYKKWVAHYKTAIK
jgi:hypothetical protein